MNNYQSNRNTSMHIHNTAFTTTSPTQHQVMGAPMPTTTQHMNIGGDAACRHMQSAVDLLLASASFQAALSARSQSQSQSQSQPQFQPQPLLRQQSLLDSQQFLLPRSLPRSPITTSNGMDTIPNAAIHIPPAAIGGVDWSPPQAQQLMSTTTTTTTATNNANAVADANATNGATLVSRPKNAGTPITGRRTTRTSNYIIEAEIITIPKRAIPLRDIETPHENDVLSGRGQSINFHSGNQHFRHLVRSLKIQYLNSKKSDKPKFAEGIVDAIRNLPGHPGRFLKQDKNGLWYDIGDKRACLKTRQSLREGAPQFLKPVSNFKCSSSSNSSISTPLPSSSGSPFTVTSGISVALHEEI